MSEPDAPLPDSISLRVPADAAGERLDRHLAGALDRPRSRLQQWIRDGRVTVDGRLVEKPSHPLTANATIVCALPQAAGPQRVEPEAGELRILYADSDLAVIDKPAGLAMHPGAGRTTGTLAHRVLHRWPETGAIGGDGRPGIVHRLDLDTTGVVLIARSDLAHRRLSADFAERRVVKIYQAAVHGAPRVPSGTVDRPIGRHPDNRKKMAVRADGRPARSHWRRLDAVERRAAVLEIGLETGRTHQIRVHLKAIGHPLIGDPTYGEARWRDAPARLRRPLGTFPRPALHARRIGFNHPRDGRPMIAEAPVPDDLVDLWSTVAGRPWPDLATDGPPG
ncbi:MAG: RluA family pseudouridine synthase [Acidobacteriota bacterium]